MRIIFIVLIAISLLNSGCVALGVGFKGNKTSTIINPGVSKDKGKIYITSVTDTSLTKDALISHWGNPDAVDAINGEEILIYKFRLRWKGLIGQLLFIPIPLIIPVGKDHIDFTIKDNIVTKVHMVDDSRHIDMWCSYNWPNLMDGCHAINDKDFEENMALKRMSEYDKNRLIRN